MLDSLLTKKKTICVNGKELVSKEVCPYFDEKRPFMIQESEVGLPMQIFKVQHLDQIDLRIIDRSYSKLEL